MSPVLCSCFYSRAQWSFVAFSYFLLLFFSSFLFPPLLFGIRLRQVLSTTSMDYRGGHSALSWAVFTAEIIKYCNVHVIAFDFRGHGGSHTSDDLGLINMSKCFWSSLFGFGSFLVSYLVQFPVLEMVSPKFDWFHVKVE